MNKYPKAAWYPVLEDFLVKHGDYVSIESNRNASIGENESATHYGVLNKMKLFKSIVTIKLNIQNEQEVMQFFRQTEWQPTEDIGSSPDASGSSYRSLR